MPTSADQTLSGRDPHARRSQASAWAGSQEECVVPTGRRLPNSSKNAKQRIPNSRKIRRCTIQITTEQRRNSESFSWSICRMNPGMFCKSQRQFEKHTSAELFILFTNHQKLSNSLVLQASSKTRRYAALDWRKCWAKERLDVLPNRPKIHKLRGFLTADRLPLRESWVLFSDALSGLLSFFSSSYVPTHSLSNPLECHSPLKSELFPDYTFLTLTFSANQKSGFCSFTQCF